MVGNTTIAIRNLHFGVMAEGSVKTLIFEEGNIDRSIDKLQVVYYLQTHTSILWAKGPLSAAGAGQTLCEIKIKMQNSWNGGPWSKRALTAALVPSQVPVHIHTRPLSGS